MKLENSITYYVDIKRKKMTNSCRFILTLTQLGISLGCYKITLNCNDKMVGYYARLDFKKEEGNANFLMLRVPNKS